jgi:excisionase family DNA binding protein
MPPQPADHVKTIAAVAETLGVHSATVRRLIRRKQLAAVRLSPRRIGVRESELKRYLHVGYATDACDILTQADRA